MKALLIALFVIATMAIEETIRYPEKLAREAKVVERTTDSTSLSPGPPTSSVGATLAIDHGYLEKVVEVATGKTVWVSLFHKASHPDVFAVVVRERHEGEYRFALVNAKDGTIEWRGVIDIPSEFPDPLVLTGDGKDSWKLSTGSWQVATTDGGKTWGSVVASTLLATK